MASSTTPRERLAALLLAVLLPAVLFSWAYDGLQRPSKPTDQAAGMERKLRRQDPLVVVLGSSLARTNVRGEQLADELGLSRRQVVLMTLPNATAAHWYAMMKNRIFANGHRPKAVVMVGALTTIVTPQVLMDTSVERLVNQLTEHEPVIARKVFGTDDPEVFRYLYMREQAGQIRDDFITSYRDWALALAFERSWKSAVGRRLAERANEVVFADAKMDYELHQKGSTGLYVGAVDEIDLTGLDIERESLISDIGALARRFGSHAVFVRTPFPPSNADNDFVPEEYEAAAMRAMEDAEAGYLDLRSLNLDESYFQDMRHMSREGATLFTSALARSIEAMGVLQKRGSVEVQKELQPVSVERVGTAPDLSMLTATAEKTGRCTWRMDPGPLEGMDTPTLAASGQARATPLRLMRSNDEIPWTAEEPNGCAAGVWFEADGLHVSPGRKASIERVSARLADEIPIDMGLESPPAYWVYPGTSLRFTFDRSWPYDPAEFKVLLLGHAFGGEPADIEVLVDGEVMGVDNRGPRIWGALNPRLPESSDWTLEVRSPEDGPFVILQNLAVGQQPRTSNLIGLPEQLAGSSIRLVGGKVEDTNLEPVYLEAPPALKVSPRVRKAARGLSMISLPAFSALADAPNSRASVPHKCSPIRVVEDGKMQQMPHETCVSVANYKAGRSCHAGNLLYLSASDSSMPHANRKKYDLALDPTRICDRRNLRDTTPLRGVLWMYPRDQLRLAFPEDLLGGFWDGANQLEVEFEAPIVREGDRLQMRLIVDGVVWLEDEIAPPGNRRRVEIYRFDPPIPPRTRDIRLEFDNPTDGSWWLVLMATLSEQHDYGFAPPRPASVVDDLALLEEVTDEGLFGEEGEDPFVEDAIGDEPASLWPPDRAARVGEMPLIPPMKDLKRLRDGMVEGHLFSLWPVSNSVLIKQGLGPWSPVRVREGDTAMRMQQGRKSFKEDCVQCFLHIGQSIITRPMDPATAEDLVVSLAPELPVRTIDGQDVWWIYPGTSVELAYDKPWSGDSLALRVETAAFQAVKGSDPKPPTMLIAGQLVTMDATEAGWAGEVEVTERGTGPWSVRIDAPTGGPFLAISGAWFRDADGLHEMIDKPVVDNPDE